ncbi:hypothetical protein QBC38DRAFT_441284 [Podospora fimiseda]|uniref:Uncharacterized protein n=1 Tax=Podospora fimiseda TaxID=252190 RepID=A0AAN7H5W5_9PEZI|nr:hypothetical protein QBC38DRAFT_441284 [Podospora fimiseda]
MSGVEEIGEEDGYTHHDRLLRESRQMNFVRTTILTEFITITTTSRPPSPPSSPPSQPASDLKPPDVDEEVSSVPIEPTSIPSHNPSQNPEPEAGGEDPLPSLTDSIIFPTATSALDPDTGAMDDSPYVVHSFPPTAGINAVPSRPPGDRRPNQVFATLLTGNCSSAKFTLLDGGPTLYYVPFVGCNNDKPGCCPFTPRTIDPIEPAKAVITFSPSITGAPDQLYAYPRPTNTNDATLDSCASDYYSVSGSCCPNGYTPWTAALGGETPCASPLTSSTRAPPITASRDPAAATKPTIVATGLVFAMQYAVQGESDQGLSLSAGAIAGIVIGSICGVLAIVGLSFFIRRRQKQSRQLVGLKKELHSNFYGTTAGTSEVPTAGRSPAPTSVRGDQSSDWARTTLRDSTAFAKEQNGGGDSGGESSSPAELYGGSSPVAMYSPDPGLFPPRRPVGSPPRPRKGQQSPLTSPINPSEIFDWPSVTSSPALPSMQVGSELQLAKPQRLSRGYAKVVYQGRGSTTSVPSDLGDHGGPGSAGRPATASSSKTSATRPMTGRMPGTPELDERPRDREM